MRSKHENTWATNKDNSTSPTSWIKADSAEMPWSHFKDVIQRRLSSVAMQMQLRRNRGRSATQNSERRNKIMRLSSARNGQMQNRKGSCGSRRKGKAKKGTQLC